ncbi:MAG: AAA family ATPase [Deltaproteobacteria bacterium]|nr:AAA family ATPase [Deltaproteobacteria bacterium]
MKFCGRCGRKLGNRCPQCGFENPPGFAFCGQCATSLTAGQEGKRGKGKGSSESRQVKTSPDKSEVRSPKSEQIPAERRQLTVMFCDLVGSTALSEQIDPEELREVVRAYQEACAAVIRRSDGYIAQYLGDGLLVYFGYPLAHEDDAQRAVRAGLGIVTEIQQLDTQLQQTVEVIRELPLQVRIGIHTGLVVIGEMGRGGKREDMALGDTPNIASRLQGIAQPNTVVISPATYRLTQGFFACRALGPYTLKGISSPLEVYQVLSESGAQSRFEVAVTTGLTPLVGREQEVRFLLERWEQAQEGMGQVVLLNGEAGIGKSRLVQVLKDRVASEAHARVEYRCSPYYQNSALYPVIDHLQRLLQSGREASPEEKLHKLEEVLEQAGLALPEVMPLFASLLSLQPDSSTGHAPRFPLPVLTPQRQRQKTLEALLAWLLKEAERWPVLLIGEDLHWADPSTLEFLSLLLDQSSTARILIVLAFRPHFSPPWATRSHITQLPLGRLGRKQVEVMVERVTGGKALPAEVLQQVVAKTDGVPLFVEELTKMVLESVGATGRSPLQPLAIPATLHDSLMARLDRLATAQEVAQLGATLGRDFSYELLQAVSPFEETELQKSLATLVQAELLYQRGLPPRATYFFKHALIQDAAYQSLLKSTRQQYHKQIAQVLEERFPETRETRPELLAYHYTEAGFREQAIPYWQRAGERAIGYSANMEAIGHLSKELELLRALPDTPERIQQELRLQIALGAPLVATKGYAAPEVERVYARARELCQQLGETPQLSPVLLGLWVFYLTQAELQTAHELGEQLLSVAQRQQDPARLLWAHMALGATFYSRGELGPARAHLEQGIVLYDPQKRRPHTFRAVQDPQVACLSYASHVLWYCGYPDQALKRSHEALALAQELSHPYSLAIALSFAAMLHQFRRERQATQERAEATIAVCTDQEFPYWLTWGTILKGWVLAEQGKGEEEIAQIRQGMAANQATGAKLWRPCFLTLLAEAYGEVGQAAEGLTLLAEALTEGHKTGERIYEAELYRLKGELSPKSRQVADKSKTSQDKSGVRSPESRQVKTSQDKSEVQSLESEAEEYFRRAIDVARSQSAKSLELRATMSLSRLWQQRGKQEEARQMLAEIYGWFTEGFDTPDLKEARALLEEMS